VPLQVGLGIGRLVFRALNVCVLALAALIVGIAAAVAILALLAQVQMVRPALTRRSNAVLAGADPPRSRGHYAYVGLQSIKAIRYW
jgi:hypothetical protein